MPIERTSAPQSDTRPSRVAADVIGVTRTDLTRPAQSRNVCITHTDRPSGQIQESSMSMLDDLDYGDTNCTTCGTALEDDRCSHCDRLTREDYQAGLTFDYARSQGCVVAFADYLATGWRPTVEQVEADHVEALDIERTVAAYKRVYAITVGDDYEDQTLETVRVDGGDVVVELSDFVGGDTVRVSRETGRQVEVTIAGRPVITLDRAWATPDTIASALSAVVSQICE